jgi:hypothetical protein
MMSACESFSSASLEFDNLFISKKYIIEFS